MSENKFKLKKELIEELEVWLNKYPKNQRQSAIIPGLHLIQDYYGGYLDTIKMDALADYLKVPKISVYEVASFYIMYDLKKVGRNKVNICNNISCMLNGANEIIDYTSKKLGIKVGETTKDGKITLKTVECQGACCGAPMLEVNKVFYENLNFSKIDEILDNLE